jgi:hypothetical protein
VVAERFEIRVVASGGTTGTQAIDRRARSTDCLWLPGMHEDFPHSGGSSTALPGRARSVGRLVIMNFWSRMTPLERHWVTFCVTVTLLILIIELIVKGHV